MVFSGIIEFNLIIKIESGLGVVVDVHLHLLPYFSLNRYVDLLVKLEVSEALLANGYVGIGDFLVLSSEVQHHRTVWPDVDEVPTKNPVKHRTEVNLRNEGTSCC